MTGHSPSQPTHKRWVYLVLTILAGAVGLSQMSQFLHGGRPVEAYLLPLALAVLSFALCGLFAWMWRRTTKGSAAGSST